MDQAVKFVLPTDPNTQSLFFWGAPKVVLPTRVGKVRPETGSNLMLTATGLRGLDKTGDAGAGRPVA